MAIKIGGIRKALGANGCRGLHAEMNREKWKKVTLEIAHAVVLTLSVLLIVFISYDTFKGIPFLQSHSYMTFQMWVCAVFIMDFFLELFLTPRALRSRYIRHRWLYLFLSIPFLNIVNAYHFDPGADALYFIRFIPLARGALALVIVLGYITSNRITGLFVSYISIVLLSLYFAALIFFEREHPVNEYITDFWQAFIWCCLEITTIGSSVAPVTVAGKIISVILAYMGLVMFPLFTVYLSSLILKRHDMLNVFKNATVSVKKSSSPDEKGASDKPEVAQTEIKA
ncbi:MAG: two pore domain potassium channel family protein [Bacteroidales bacterium]|nr:two pore domain potassium channel family protein [Bacteroidales bacterium]